MVTVRFWQTIHTRASSVQPSAQLVSELATCVMSALLFETTTSVNTVRQVFQFEKVSVAPLVTHRASIVVALVSSTWLETPAITTVSPEPGTPAGFHADAVSQKLDPPIQVFTSA